MFTKSCNYSDPIGRYFDHDVVICCDVRRSDWPSCFYRTIPKTFQEHRQLRGKCVFARVVGLTRDGLEILTGDEAFRFETFRR